MGFSQKGISYQAVILDPNKIELPGEDITGQPLYSADVWVKFSIYNGSFLEFEEVHKTKTDEYGLVNLLIGSVSTASFNRLVWDKIQKKLNVHVSFNQGASYTQVSDQTLQYIPYALYADTAGAASTADKLKSTLGILGGGTGATTAVGARANLGLSNIDNTSDADKPISMATKAALDSIAVVISKVANTTGAVATATTPDATAAVKGKLQLAGDLAGTADAPTVAPLAITTAKIADGAVTLIKQANIATASLLGRSTAGSGSPEVLTASAAKTLLALTKTDVGLASVDNTTDLLKPISTATQTALDLKATIASPAFTGIPTAITAASGTNSTQIATTAYVDAAITSVSAGTTTGTSTTPDATAAVKGKVQLAGDLSGTAEAPTVAALAITTLKIADNAITSAKISDLTISAAKIANNAVTTAKILDANITTAKILDANITTAKILDANVTTTKIADAAVTTAKIADAAVTTAKILDANVTTAKILDANVTTAKIADVAITTAKILDANVTGVKIAIGTISNTNLVNVPSKTFKGRTDFADGVVQDLTVTQVRADLAINLVDNTSDASKPVSTLTQTALDLKANLASPALTGSPTAPTQNAGDNSTKVATTAYVDAANRTIFSTRVSLSSTATPAPIGSSLFNYYTLAAQAVGATFDAPSGTPLDGNSLVLKIKASSTEIAIAWNAIYRGGTDISLPTTTNKTMVLHFMYNAADAKWDLVGITNGI